MKAGNGQSLAIRIAILVFAAAFVVGGVIFGKAALEDLQGDKSYAALQQQMMQVQTQPAGSDTPASAAPAADAPGETPTPETTRTSEIDFAVLKAINPDVCAWLRAEDTVIDYPVVHGTDNEYYLKHLYTGQKNRNGSVFVDCGNTGLFTEQNTLIFGHNMQSGAMFGTLKGYKKQDYYDAHPTMTLYTPAGDYTLELIAGTVEDGAYTFAKCSFDSSEEFFDYVADLKSRSTFQSSVEVQEDDRLVSLCTCTYEFSNARYVVVGKLTALP